MKKLSLLLVLGAWLLASSCSTPSDSSSTPPTDPQPSPSNEAPAPDPEPDPSPEETEKPMASIYKGKLDGKHPVTLELCLVEEDIVSASLVYDKVGEPIPLRGSNTPWDNSFWAYEFTPDGLITGTWIFDLKEDSLTGTWNDFPKGKSMSANLVKTGEQVYSSPVAMAGRSGTFEFDREKEAGASGELTISPGKEFGLNFEIVTVGPAPGHSIAEIEKTEIELEGNRAVYEDLTGDFMDCRFEVLLYYDFVVIRYLDEKTECGFGHNAHVDGVYFKTK